MPLREIAGPAGRLEALLEEPAADSSLHAAVVLAHPHPQYGGTMHTKGVYQAAKGLARIGCAVLRFNFRGAGASAGTFDEGRGEMDDYDAALHFMHERYRAARGPTNSPHPSSRKRSAALRQSSRARSTT